MIGTKKRLLGNLDIYRLSGTKAFVLKYLIRTKFYLFILYVFFQLFQKKNGPCRYLAFSLRGTNFTVMYLPMRLGWLAARLFFYYMGFVL